MAALPPLVGPGCSAWHTLVIAGQAAPGICTVKPKKGFKVDKKAGLGEDGGTTTLHGKDVPTVSVVIRVWTQAQLEAVAALLATLFPSGPAPDPFTVSHPVLAMQGITSLFFESVEGPNQVEPGLWEVTFSTTEFRTPKSVGSTTPTKSVGADNGNALFDKRKKRVPKERPPRVAPPPPPPKFKPGSWY